MFSLKHYVPADSALLYLLFPFMSFSRSTERPSLTPKHPTPLLLFLPLPIPLWLFSVQVNNFSTPPPGVQSRAFYCVMKSAEGLCSALLHPRTGELDSFHPGVNPSPATAKRKRNTCVHTSVFNTLRVSAD